MTTKQKIKSWVKRLLYIKKLLNQEHELKKMGVDLY